MVGGGPAGPASDVSRWVEEGPVRPAAAGAVLHSMVPGGLDVMSRATGLTPSTSLMIREEALQDVVGEARPVGRHGVVAGDGPDHDQVA